MESRTYRFFERIGLVGRLLTILLALGVWHLTARLLWHNIPDYRASDLADCLYNGGFTFGVVGDRIVSHKVDCSVFQSSPWWGYHPTNWWGVLGTHLLALLVLVVATIVIVLVSMALMWILGWIVWHENIFAHDDEDDDEEEDPCKDPAHCPCPRHRVEEQKVAEADGLAEAAIVATSAAATSAVTTSDNS